MNAQELNQVAGAIESLVTVAAILIGAGWAYRKFVVQREAEPATDLDINVDFVGVQRGQWIIQITATLANRSLVRLSYRDFQITVRYLLANDAVEDGDDRVGYQLKCDRTIDERIKGAKRLFANAVWINPRQEFRHRYVTYVPADTTFVWVQGKFFFTSAGQSEKSNTQKIFRVPKATSQAATGVEEARLT